MGKLQQIKILQYEKNQNSLLEQSDCNKSL